MSNGFQDHRSFPFPHISAGGHALCTNPKCKARLLRSNAILNSENKMLKAMMFTNSAKLFVIERSIIAECSCGNKYDVGQIALEKSSIFFERNGKS